MPRGHPIPEIQQFVGSQGPWIIFSQLWGERYDERSGRA